MKFGYDIIKGKIIINSMQSNVVKKMMLDYKAGETLKTISEELTKQKIEYAPGKYQWNKNRVQRILTDITYLGNETYPAIVSKELFAEVQEIMDSRNTQKNIKRDEIFSSAIVPICCGKCGGLTERRYEGRTKVESVFHTCINPECKTSYMIYDIDLRRMVRDLLMEADEIIVAPSEDINHEIVSLKNQINRELESSEINAESVKNKIFKCAALQYDQYTKPRESIDYSKMCLCSLEFNREIKRRVKCVCLESNSNIWLCLNDGQIVGREVVNNEYIT